MAEVESHFKEHSGSDNDRWDDKLDRGDLAQRSTDVSPKERRFQSPEEARKRKVKESKEARKRKMKEYPVEFSVDLNNFPIQDNNVKVVMTGTDENGEDFHQCTEDIQILGDRITLRNRFYAKYSMQHDPRIKIQIMEAASRILNSGSRAHRIIGKAFFDLSELVRARHVSRSVVNDRNRALDHELRRNGCTLLVKALRLNVDVNIGARSVFSLDLRDQVYSLVAVYCKDGRSRQHKLVGCTNCVTGKNPIFRRRFGFKYNATRDQDIRLELYADSVPIPIETPLPHKNLIGHAQVRLSDIISAGPQGRNCRLRSERPNIAEKVRKDDCGLILSGQSPLPFVQVENLLFQSTHNSSGDLSAPVSPERVRAPIRSPANGTNRTTGQPNDSGKPLRRASLPPPSVTGEGLGTLWLQLRCRNLPEVGKQHLKASTFVTVEVKDAEDGEFEIIGSTEVIDSCSDPVYRKKLAIRGAQRKPLIFRANVWEDFGDRAFLQHHGHANALLGLYI